MSNQKTKEKEKEIELKHLRRELEEKLTDQLPQELLETKEFKDAKFVEREIQTDEEAKRIIEAVIFSSAKPMMPCRHCSFGSTRSEKRKRRIHCARSSSLRARRERLPLRPA